MDNESLILLAQRMRRNSERWFPDLHFKSTIPLAAFYSLGLAGEAGEVANLTKKSMRKWSAEGEWVDAEDIGEELADVFTYLLLLADECEVDLLAEYEAKVRICNDRWGQP